MQPSKTFFFRAPGPVRVDWVSQGKGRGGRERLTDVIVLVVKILSLSLYIYIHIRRDRETERERERERETSHHHHIINITIIIVVIVVIIIMFIMFMIDNSTTICIYRPTFPSPPPSSGYQGKQNCAVIASTNVADKLFVWLRWFQTTSRSLYLPSLLCKLIILCSH